MQLDHIQSEFAAALLDADSPPPKGVVGRDGSPALRRFAVYRNNVTASLVDTLKEGFPVTVSIVGDEFFRAMAVVFVRNCPPSSPIMMLYGDQLPEFLQTFQPVAHLHYLPDIARLEQLRREVYHAADAEPLPADFLNGIAPHELPTMQFEIAPATRILGSDYPVLSIWNWHNTSDAGERLILPDTGENVLVTRHEGIVFVQQIAPATAAFFASLMAQETFQDAAEIANTHQGFDLAGSISALIGSRIVTQLIN